MNTTGVIMASGEGSRLKAITTKVGLPKHLLPLGEHTSVSLILKDLKECCNQIILVCSDHEKKIFEDKLLPIAPNLQVVAKNEKGFAGDYRIALKYAQNEHIILTVGDIIFKPGEITNQIQKVKQLFPKFTLVFDRYQLLKKLDFRMVMASTDKTMLEFISQVDPESFFKVAYHFTRLFLINRVRASFADVLFNLNTPESYALAKSYFEKRSSY